MNTIHEHPTAARTAFDHEGVDRDATQTRAGLSREGAPAADPFLEATDRLRGEFKKACTSFKRSLYVQRQALRLSAFDAAFKTAVFLCIALSGFALILAAVLLFITSARSGIALLTDGAWWSDLPLALALVGLVFVAARTLRSYVHRSVLARTRRELAKTPEITA